MIREITDYAEWTDFLNSAGSPSFLQSWEWGTLNEKHSNYGIIRLALCDAQNNTLATAQVLKIRAKRGNFLFVPHGPTFANIEGFDKLLEEFRDYLITIAKQESYDFIRLSPVIEMEEGRAAHYRRLGFRTAPIYMHAERIWVLPLQSSNNTSLTEEQLLADMRKTTRYLIRRAPKDGVTIERRTDAKAIDDFWKLYTETASRESFTPFSKAFVAAEFEEFYKNGNAEYFFGKVDGEYLAGALVIYTKSTAFYHQGASRHTKFPVPYALQWEAIKAAKERGCTLYNFWGILQEGRTPKAWSGLTLFKKGFSGKQIDYIPTQDYVVNPFKYAISWLFETYLLWKRGV